MKKTIFKGCGTALATPFTDDNKINYDCFEKFLNFQLGKSTPFIQLFKSFLEVLVNLFLFFFTSFFSIFFQFLF